MKIAAVIPVAGTGSRFASKTPKQFHQIADQPVIAITIKHLMAAGDIGQFVFAVSDENRHTLEEIINHQKSDAVDFTMVSGGSTRQASVFNGLKGVDEDTKVVLVHDGVRPLVSVRLIRESIRCALKHGICVPAVPLRDTVKRVDSEIVLETLTREELWQVQTPQTFQYHILYDIHQRARIQNFTGTDDASLAEWSEIPVHVIRGDEMNIKITTKSDLQLAAFYLERMNG